jgi:hypothetical protein
MTAVLTPYPTGQAFAAWVNTTFRLHVDDEQVIDIELVTFQAGMSTLATEQFALTFEAAPADVPQGLYRLEHERLGSLEMFLVPVGRTARGVQLEAVFNTVIKGPESGVK